MSIQTYDSILAQFSAQLGELAWHQVTIDASLDTVTAEHTKHIRTLINRFLPADRQRPLRFLELGAYCHYTAHQLMSESDVEAVASDISPHSLRTGLGLAEKNGLKQRATLVTADFHDLPFSDDYFDAVFVASSLHHTLRTSKVLEEIGRIISPGGIFIIDNEPMGREFCFYQFRSNRLESFSTLEQDLYDLGLLHTISSPFPGSRPEELFGMIENDRIEKKTFDTFIAGYDILELNVSPIMGPFEDAIISPDMDQTARVQKLDDALAQSRRNITKAETLMGMSLPAREAIQALCERTEDRFRQVQNAIDPKLRQDLLADLFGAVLQTTLRKQGIAKSPRLEKMFRRPIAEFDGVFNGLPTLDGVLIGLDHILIPEILETNKIALQHYFSPEHWVLFREAQEIDSLLNLKDTQTIMLPDREDDAVLLLRFYAVGRPEEPYFIDIRIDGKTIENYPVCVSESRLSKLYVPAEARAVEMVTRSESGTPITLPTYIHLSVCRLVPFKTMPKNAARKFLGSWFKRPG